MTANTLCKEKYLFAIALYELSIISCHLNSSGIWIFQFRAKALGTPKPNILWQKDDEPIFITEGIEIQDEPDGSLLTVHNLQVEDEGVIQCIAVNQVGKAIASTALCIVALPKFKVKHYLA